MRNRAFPNRPGKGDAPARRAPAHTPLLHGPGTSEPLRGRCSRTLLPARRGRGPNRPAALGVPDLDPLLAKAKEARTKNVRYPLDPADLERQRSQLLSQLEQAELGSTAHQSRSEAPARASLCTRGRAALAVRATSRSIPLRSIPTRPPPRRVPIVRNCAGLRAFHDGLTRTRYPSCANYLHAGSPLARRARPRPGSAAGAAPASPDCTRGPTRPRSRNWKCRRKQLANSSPTASGSSPMKPVPRP